MLIHLLCKCLFTGSEEKPRVGSMSQSRPQANTVHEKLNFSQIPRLKGQGSRHWYPMKELLLRHPIVWGRRARMGKREQRVYRNNCGRIHLSASSKKQCAQKCRDPRMLLLRSGSNVPRCMQRHPDSHNKTRKHHAHMCTEVLRCDLGQGRVSL